MTTRPYELLARFANDGSIAGVSVRTITTVNGRDYESDPSPLSGATDPAFVAFASQFSAAIVAQRDQLLTDKAALETQVTTLTSERDALQSQVDQLTAQNAALASQGEALAEAIATVTGERDSLTQELVTVTSERDTHALRIVELEAQIDALLNPPVNPRHLAPFDFLALLKPEEIYALQTSVDPIVVVGRAKLQTIITYVDLDHADTVGLAQYMEASGMIAQGRADRILSGQPPE